MKKYELQRQKKKFGFDDECIYQVWMTRDLNVSHCINTTSKKLSRGSQDRVQIIWGACLNQEATIVQDAILQ